MDTREAFTAALVAIFSGLGLAAVYLTQYLLAVPIVAVLLAGSMTYIVQRRIQSTNRRNSIWELAIQDSLSPIYAEIIKIQEALDACEASRERNYPRGWEDAWNNIRLSHRIHITPQPLRSTVEAYFTRLGALESSSYLTSNDLKRIEEGTWTQVLQVPPYDANQSAFCWLTKQDRDLRTNMTGLIFWRSNPNELSGYSWKRLEVYRYDSSGKQDNIEIAPEEEIRRKVDAFCDIAFPWSDKEGRVTAERKELEEIRKETSKLRLMLENEFKKWAS